MEVWVSSGLPQGQGLWQGPRRVSGTYYSSPGKAGISGLHSRLPRVLEPTEWPTGSQASCGFWREDSVLLSRPCRKRRPSSRDDAFPIAPLSTHPHPLPSLPSSVAALPLHATECLWGLSCLIALCSIPSAWREAPPGLAASACAAFECAGAWGRAAGRLGLLLQCAPSPLEGPGSQGLCSVVTQTL